jgi:hypothetical protein
MSNFSDIIPLILDNKMNQAKSLLEQRMYSKLGVVLENKLEEYAPTIFITEEERALYEEEMKKKPDEDGDGVPDWADKYPGKDDKEEEADDSEDEDEEDDEDKKKSKKKSKKDDEEDDEDMNEEYELFIEELTQLVEDIEEELGEELTEEEIQELADELLSESTDGQEEICEDCK